MSISQHRIHAEECPCATCRERARLRRTRPVYSVIAAAVLIVLLSAALSWAFGR